MLPQFPTFKSIELTDREVIHDIFQAYRPETSELTFTNLYIWREHYKIQWSIHKDWLVAACEVGGRNCFSLPPVGPAPRIEVTRLVLEWLKEEKGISEPVIERADQRLADEVRYSGLFAVAPSRDHFDYLYLAENLVKLSGNRYHGKKNHLNKFRKTYNWTYEPLSRERIPACLEVSELWCKARRCSEDLDLMDEAIAVKSILENSEALDVKGGLILIDGKVEAFSLGEILGADTAVVHIEKANPDIPQLFVVINQQFVEHECQNAKFVNREQDLGDEGLRQAKLSYHPERMVEKFILKLR
jgi:uncharacterized protein